MAPGRKEGDDWWAWFISGGDGCAGERLSGERRLTGVARLSAGARARAGERNRAAAAGLSVEGEWEGGGPRGKTDWAGVGERRSRAEERTEQAGWAAFVFLFFLPLFFSKHHSNYLNSNSNLNSTLTLKQIEIMHQHECNNKLIPRKF